MSINQKDLLSDSTEGALTYIGIDPGENGGFAYITEDTITLESMKDFTDTDLWYRLSCTSRVGVFACIEQQTPRPTQFMKNGVWQSTILASTCILYGRYIQAKSFLIAAGIPFENVPPKRWQKGLHIPPKSKSMKQADWKNVLKEKAQQLFPDEKVTLATCDALLLAEFCRRSREGKL